MIVIAVKESSFLIAVDAVVGGVEVENQMSRRRRVGGDELIDQDFGDLDERLSIEPILQSAQGRRRGEGRALLGRFADGDLQAGIDAKLLMIVEVFISEGDGDDALGDHNALIVDDEEGVSRVGDRLVESVEQTDLVGGLAKQERPGVGGEPTSLKVGDDGLGPEAGKPENVSVTVCHGGGLARKGCVLCVNPYPITSKAVVPLQIPICG